eukprot:TRINITY_DN8493_c0_g1_i1.p1 TRINITY_DN8493_c0_g1~~TRINITY_DN8493_c0_g1_i1.p1  ORF type:complete len:706 (-),score=107.56 TRINITY_DN8493_c0_g1_i1:120-1928(-)
MEGMIIDDIKSELKLGKSEISINVNTKSWEDFFMVGNLLPGEFGIIIANPSLDNICKALGIPADSDDPIAYAYSVNGFRTQNWIGPGRFLILDLTAGSVGFGPTDITEGGVISENFPSDPIGSSAMLRSVRQLEARLASIVIDAARFVLVPDMQQRTADATRILVPLVALRNHRSFDPWNVDEPEYGIDLIAIQDAVQKMALPGQEITIVKDIHGLHEHKHIAISVKKAMFSDTVHELNNKARYVVREKPYLDSGTLLQSFGDAVDVIAGGYLQGENAEALNGFYTDTQPSRNATTPLGVRIVPVYILSLTNVPSSLIIDQESFWAASPQAVVVLQTDSKRVQVPYVSESSPVYLNPRNPSRAIIAGVASALAGLSSSTQRYSPLHNREVQDYTWACGYTPFGPFSKSLQLSQIFYDMILRNAILSRVDLAYYDVHHALEQVNDFSEKFLWDPFGQALDDSPPLTWTDYFMADEEIVESPVSKDLVKRIRSQGRGLQDSIRQISTQFQQFKLDGAYQLSASVVIAAASFRQYTAAELNRAETDMLCCVLKHEIKPSARSASQIWFFILFLIVVLLAVSYLYTKNIFRFKQSRVRRNRKIRQN